MIVEQKLRDIQVRAKDIETKMNSGEISGEELTKLSKEYSQMSEVLPLIDKYLQTQQGIKDATEMLNDPELKSDFSACERNIYSAMKTLGFINRKVVGFSTDLDADRN